MSKGPDAGGPAGSSASNDDARRFGAAPAQAEDSRDETEDERADRNWAELLQELRVTQMGVQILTGFLLTLPFQERFETLDTVQRNIYLCLVVLSVLATGLLVAPVSLHRMMFRKHLKARLVTSADRLARMGLVVLAVVVLVQASRLDNGDDLVGAATAPWVVGALTFVVGVLLVVRGRRDMGVWEVSEHARPQDWRRMLVLLAVLLVFAVIVPWLGYVVSATLLFGATAVVLGAPDRVRAFVYGFSVAALVFLLFDTAIGISLPAGPWGF